VTSPPPTLQARAAAIAPLRRQGERLLGRLLRRSAAVVVPRGESSGGSDPFLEVGRRLRAAREFRGLSLRQLAQETRISITVLEALEKGWRDRLPEPAYMRTMLALLEQHLSLERGSLEAALPPRTPRSSLRSSLKAHAERVPLTSIELFATWQGTLLYALLCLLLIYGLNRQQQRLVVQGLLPLHTVAARPAPASGAASAAERDRAKLLAAYPDLRPLERARRGQGLLLLRRQDGTSSTSPAASAKPAAAPPQNSTSTSPAGASAAGDQDAAAVPPRP
jgi:transcriptional regulator with XRE-family HTH domain